MQATKQGVFNAIHNPKEVFNNLMIEHEQAGNAIATCYCTETWGPFVLFSFVGIQRIGISICNITDTETEKSHTTQYTIHI